MKIVGICEKYSVIAMVVVIGILFTATLRSQMSPLPSTLYALKSNIKEYLALKEIITTEWKFKHKTALAFAPDHGCHRWLGLLGNHGINLPCDMNTVHFWTFI